MKGVRENYALGKQICVLAEDLKGTIEPNALYSVELKPMHKAKGYVVVAATPVQFPATVETIIAPKTLYKVTVSFGNKTIYLDLKDGKSAMSRTLDGVLPVLKERKDIKNHGEVIADFIKQGSGVDTPIRTGRIYLHRQALHRRWSQMKRPTVGIATDGAHSYREVVLT